jgi:mannose/cellobiose epimerase-like protein (N-acyl-D-glucosamine 2-epimerase family)
MNLKQVADELAKRVVSLFVKDESGTRKVYGKDNWFYQQAGNEHLILFYEYFHGDEGSGLGASHQTGWTSLVARLISELNNGNGY